MGSLAVHVEPLIGVFVSFDIILLECVIDDNYLGNDIDSRRLRAYR